VYAGSNANPTHITALSSNQWLVANTTCSGSNSMLPTSLTNGVNAIQHALTKGGTGLNTANAMYTGSMKGSIAQLKALIHDTANWNGTASGSAAQTWPTWTFPGSPSVTKAELINATTVRVIFSADMDKTSATDVANYTGIANLQTASMSNNGGSIDTVTLTYSTPFTSGQSYSLLVSNVKDAEARKLFNPYTFNFSFNAEFAFASRFVVVKESAGSAIVRVNMKFPGTGSVKLTPRFGPFSTALSADHTFASTTVTFNSSTSFVDVTIPIFNDKVSEQDEYLNILMESPTGGIIAGLPFITVYVQDDDRAIINPARNIELNHIESFDPNPTAGSTTEIVVHDAKSQRLFMTSAVQKRMDIADFSNPKDITLVKSIDMTPYGGITSIAVKNDVVAVASPNVNEQLDGQVVFFSTNGDFISKVTVGALPDMITFTPDGKKVLTANEGQPNTDYSIDPEGSISVIDISGGAANLTQANVKTIDFKSFNAGEADLKAKGVRKLYAPSTLSQDFEPEYITVAA
ncbi:MAG: choice-of-anchor I domain-containing protein, partial [Bacteroidota bacterium]